MNGINTNITLLIGRHGCMRAQATMDKAMERLVTGKRINRASDDPSGLIAADNLKARRVTIEELIAGAEMASRMLDAAEGGLGEIANLAQELNGLVLAAASTGAGGQGEREALEVEAGAIIRAMAHIITTTTFNGKRILADGSGMDYNGRWMSVGGMDISRMGVVSVERVDPTTGDVTVVRYNLGDILNGPLNLVNGDLESAQLVAESVVKSLAMARAAIGAQQKYTLGSRIDTLRTEHENTTAAESLIRDADFAEEVSTLIRGQVLRDASLAVMRIGQEQARRALELLG